MTPIELEIFLEIYFLNFCYLVCVLINSTVRSSSFQFTKFTCETWLKQHLKLAFKSFFEILCVFGCNFSSFGNMNRFF